MVSFRASDLVIKAIGVTAILFGIVTLISGGNALFVLLELAEPPAKIVPFVLYFNFAAGFVYIVTGVGLFLRLRWAPVFATLIAAATTVVFVGLGVWIFVGNAYEGRTVIAMTLRAAFWCVASFISINRNRTLPAQSTDQPSNE